MASVNALLSMKTEKIFLQWLRQEMRGEKVGGGKGETIILLTN